ncbi:HDOD domain-containing protein [Motiliproteus coralliicola]|uniref:HDOD domain-containing protein n=1 Tax=Motiliproteus coralliicola TaxID=2283196 RepID=A0A369WU86_9GAMM|nr:HDOD domain-containing protein [Motiliproteus coralliicola]RDE25232.1 HDOD domain-containing protein [Motiliproteus coralliicola]
MNGKPYLIPPRPEVLLTLTRLVKAEEPDFDTIVETIKTDVSIYTVVLSMANSPRYAGVQKFTSLHQVVMRLGLKRLYSLIELIVLKKSLSKAGRLERFWDSAIEVAELSAMLAPRVSSEDPDTAYTVGMLHDCGIPLMIESYPDYREFLGAIEGQQVAALSLQENERYGVDHFSIGAEIAETWGMPDRVCQAIRLQLQYPTVLLDASDHSNDSSKTLLCLIMLAKNISERYRRYWRLSSSSPDISDLLPTLTYLGLSDLDYIDLRDHCLDQLECRA